MARQNEQFGVGGEDLPHRILKLMTGLYASPHLVDPFFGETFDAALAVRHKGESPSLMAWALGAVTRGLPATGTADGEGTREHIGGHGDAAEQIELALPPAGGLGAFGVSNHLVVIILQELLKIKHKCWMRK
ncbi:MAG TPA: hypothetical protein VLW83_04165 [Candidatus Acidoferrales bacterium]|nr:hypothetical protein [Candidatus Acidoferrales bacterium]